MNSLIKEPQVNVPSTTPTVGATLGAVLGTFLAGPAAGVGIPPAITMPILSGFGAWFAHFLHTKLGTPE